MTTFRTESQHPTGHPVTVAVARTKVKETQCRIPQQQQPDYPLSSLTLSTAAVSVDVVAARQRCSSYCNIHCSVGSMSTAAVSVDAVARDRKHWVLRAQCFLSPDCLRTLAPTTKTWPGHWREAQNTVPETAQYTIYVTLDLVFLWCCVLIYVPRSRAILRTCAKVSEKLVALIFRVKVILLWIWRQYVFPKLRYQCPFSVVRSLC